MIEQIFRNPGVFFFSVILALIPTIAWGYYFYQKDPVPKKTALVTFFAGALALVPVLFYQFSWSHIPDINIHYYIPQLINSPGWYTIGFFIIVFEVVAFISAVISAFAVIVVSLVTWTKGITKNVIRAITEENSNFKTIGALIAVFAAIVIYSGYSLTEALIVAVSFATLEEFVKHLIVRFVDDNRLKSIDDAIEFSILVGLGFAFAENIFYFFSAWKTNSFAQIFIFRSIFSIFAHVFFSGVFGYFYGLAHFATPIYHEEVHKNRHAFLRILHKILHMRGDVLFHEEKMMEGLLIASIFHGIFNHLRQLNQVVFVIPFLFVGFFILSYLFDRKEDHKEFQFVSAERTTGKIDKMKPV